MSAPVRPYTWSTDSAGGTIHATSVEDAVARLIADGEWPKDDAAVIADGAWLTIDGEDVRGVSP